MMKNKPLTLTAALLAVIGAAATTHAATIANFQFNDLTSSDAGTSWTTSSTSGVVNVDGQNPHGIVSDIANPGSSFALTMGDINGFSGSQVSYFEFTVTPDAGTTIDFTSFGIDLYKVSGGADVTATLRSSVDSFSSNFGFAQTGAPTGSWVETTDTTNIAALAPITSATTFRVEMFTTGGTISNPIRVDNIVLEGDVTTVVSAVPEPSTALLTLLASSALFLRRRRG